ncbi:GNAT family N-acetyltransferase [Kitasatospora sp. CM 4170]|uniref:GNAT family N-acetyltransferase n=1 Tax=Kitasatospora aburaviensis TaxID=67265 RepID=A0ABW1EZI9_9ACTN|nr:GNAT family N-acetyltransferase [Kitasatospora sp. CM 4170]WNM49922.1 GNAT family N-acetyltransferase [Kitasatospora sp. CM 4170]
MDHEKLLALLDARMRRGAGAETPAARIEQGAGVVRQSGPESVWNGVLWSDLDAGTADGVIAEQVRHYTELGQDFEWTLYAHDRPADLADRLVAAGFTPDEPETLMVAEVADLVRRTDGTGAPGIELREVTDEAGVAQVVAVHEQAFGRDGTRLGRRILAQLAESPDTFKVHLAVAHEDGREIPVSAARLELYPGTGFVGLWGGGTLAGWRGRGIYRALVAHRARIAAELGYKYLRVDASDQSRPILERLGFAALTTMTPYHYDLFRADR